jgi:hypothetical protein
MHPHVQVALLPDRHGIAPLPHGQRYQLAVRLAGTRRWRAPEWGHTKPVGTSDAVAGFGALESVDTSIVVAGFGGHSAGRHLFAE